MIKKIVVKIGKQIKQGFSHFGTTFKLVGQQHVYFNQKTLIKSLVVLFIPFLYAFISLWGFFDPIGNLNRLPIALVNQDTSPNRIINRDVLALETVKPDQQGAYRFQINNIVINGKAKPFTIAYFDDCATYQNQQHQPLYLATILIDQHFTDQFNHYFHEVFTIVMDNITAKTPAKIWPEIGALTDQPKITLQTSYKINPILGEIGDFFFNNALKANLINEIVPVAISNGLFDYWQHDAINNNNDYGHWEPKLSQYYQYFSILIPGIAEHNADFQTAIANVKNQQSWAETKKSEAQYWINHRLSGDVKLIDFNMNIIGEDKSPYGFGLGPYFICIGTWIGGLILAFNFSSRKPTPKTKFWANYFAKSAWLSIFASLQATILTTALLFLYQSHDLLIRSWQFYLFMWLLAICFNLIIQALTFMVKSKDAGRLIVIVGLILQLSASGGTFPVVLEPGFFQLLYHLLPFTYAINGLREILFQPVISNLLIAIGCLILIVIILMAISLIINYCRVYFEKAKHSK